MTLRQYLGMIYDALITTFKGMAITIGVFARVNRKGAITIQYPEVRDQLPMGSRGLLFNDVADCISCRQCSAVCPVDCIYIEADKKSPTDAAEYTSGGVKKTLNLKSFEIDVALCCYCGLCSAACPTDCLYHTKEYEYSKYERDKLTFEYMAFKQ